MRHPIQLVRDNDYQMADGDQAIWLEIGPVTLFIRRKHEALKVSAYPTGNECDDALAAFCLPLMEGCP